MPLRAVSQGSSGGGQASILFQDEGSNLGTQGTVDTIDFVGSGVAASRIGNKVTVNVSSGGGGAPTDASYVVLGANAGLSDERVLQGTLPITITDGGIGGNVTIGVNTFGAAASGIVPASGGGTTNFLRADGSWAAPPGGGGGLSHPQVMARAQFSGAF